MPGSVDAPPPAPSAPLRAPLDVPLVRLDPDLPPPAHAHPGDAGVDLRCTTDVRLEPGERVLVGTGIAVAIPLGYVGFVTPRSGLAVRTGLSMVNAPGTIDAGYRGEIGVCLVNLDPREPVQLRRGDRVAQLVVQPVEQLRFTEVAELPGSARGAGGFGSTGGHARLTAGPLAAAAVTADPGRNDLAGVESVDRTARPGPADHG